MEPVESAQYNRRDPDGVVVVPTDSLNGYDPGVYQMGDV